MKKFKFTIAIMLMVLTMLMFFGISEAIVRNGSVPGRTGLSFSSIKYSFRTLDVTIRNRTNRNVNFGGTMIFRDKNYKVIARAELLNAGIKRNSSRKYRGFFTKGSGHEAESAKYLDWEF